MDPTLRKAIVAAKGSDRPHARRLLLQLTRKEPQNEMAWLWLGYLLDDEKQTCKALEHALRINPDSVLLQAALARIGNASPKIAVPPRPPRAAPPPSNAEIIHFQNDGILISNRRAVFPDTAYTTANITSVSHVDGVSEQKTTHDRLILAGIFLTLGTAAALNFVRPGGLLDALANLVVVAGLLLLVVGWVGTTEKVTSHIVRIRTASGEVDAYTTSDGQVAEKLIEALDKAKST